MVRLSIALWPLRARVHLMRGRRRMPLILRHVVYLGLVGRVRRRIAWAVGREGRIYRDGAVRLEGRRGSRRGQERTCCLSHTGRRATRMGVGSVGGRTREVVLVGGRASRVRGVQPVVRLGGVGGRDIGGSNLRLRFVFHLGLRRVIVLSRGSSRGLVCEGRGGRFRRCFGDGRWVVRT